MVSYIRPRASSAEEAAGGVFSLPKVRLMSPAVGGAISANGWESKSRVGGKIAVLLATASA